MKENTTLLWPRELSYPLTLALVPNTPLQLLLFTKCSFLGNLKGSQVLVI